MKQTGGLISGKRLRISCVGDQCDCGCSNPGEKCWQKAVAELLFVPFSGREISIDLNFDSQTISEDLAERIKAFIDRIPELNEKYLAAIQTDYLTGDTVKEYIEAHLDILADPEVVSTLETYFSSNTASCASW